MKKPGRKRVLMLVENRPFPYDVRVLPEAQALFAAGYQVSVISPAGRKQPLHENVDGIYVFHYPAPPSGGNFLGYVWNMGIRSWPCLSCPCLSGFAPALTLSTRQIPRIPLYLLQCFTSC